MKQGPRNESRSLRIARGRQAAFTVADQVASGASNLLLTLVVAHASSAQEFGRFSLLITNYATGLLICRAAVGQVLVIRRTTNLATPGALGVAVGIGLLASLFVVGLAVADVVPWAYVVLAVVGLPLLLLQDVMRFSCFSVGNAVLALKADLVWLLGAGITAILCLRAPHFEADAYFSYWVCWALFSAILMLKVTRKLVSPWNVRAAWIESRSVSIALLIEALLTLGVLYAQLIAFARVGGVAAIGALRAAQTLYSPINTFVALTTIVLLPYVALWEREARHAARQRLTIVGAGLSAAIALFATTLSVLPEKVGVGILGPSWGSAHDLAIPIGAGVAAAALSYLPSTIVKARGRSLLLVRASMGGAAVELVSLLLGAIAGVSARQLAYISAVGWLGGLVVWLFAAARSQPGSGPQPGVIV